VDPILGLTFIAFAHSFSGIVRWKDPDSFLLAGFGTVFAILFILGYCFNVLLRLRFRIPILRGGWWAIKVLLLVWLSFSLLIVFNIIGNWQGLTSVMMIREYIIPLLILPFAISALYSSRRDCRLVLGALALGCSIVALINIVHYIVGLPISLPRWVPKLNIMTGLSSEAPEFRLIYGDIALPRMMHVFGLSGAGAGGVYYITLAFTAFYLAVKMHSRVWKFSLYTGSAVNFIAGFFTLSFSIIVSAIFIVVFLSIAGHYRHRISRISLRMAFAGIFIACLLFFLSPSLGEEYEKVAVLNYIANIWSTLVSPTLSGFDGFIIGDGLGLKSGAAIFASDTTTPKGLFLTDQWLLVVLYQLGIVGFIMSLVLLILPAWMSNVLYNQGKDNEYDHYVLAAGVIIIGFLGFVHGSAVIERLFSTPVMLAIAIIIVAWRSNKLQRLPCVIESNKLGIERICKCG